jgi:sugar (pentulose or hexulose) kinase/TRAP-type C4-dicarboxylate transport system permease small subunit
MKGIVTLDVGTTHIKGYLFSEQGAKLHHVTHPTSFLKRENGISQIDPDQVLSIVVSILKILASEGPKVATVEAVVISGMASSFIPVNQRGKPLHPCVCWNDQKSAATVSLTDLEIIQADIQQYPLPMYLPFRIKWFSANNPEILSETYKWLNLTDYILFHLSAQKEFITDYSQASRTMLFNSFTKQWNYPVAEHFNIKLEQLPLPKPSGTLMGALDPNYQIGTIYTKTQLILGGHDHMFAALASGIHNKSVALNSTGTSEALVLPYHHHPSFSFFREECNLESHIMNDELLVVGYVASTGSIMDWGNRLFHLFKWEQQTNIESFMNDRMQALPLYVPSGRRMLPSRTGRFIDIQPLHDDQDFSLSVMEGLCFEAKALLDHLNASLQVQTELLRLVGGSSKAINFLQLKSSIVQRPIEVIHDVDMTSLGGFILCGLTLQHFSDVSQIAAELLNHQKRTLLIPNGEISSRFEQRYHRYLQERGGLIMLKLSRAVGHLLNILLFIIVAVMCVLYFGNVLLRYAFNSGIPFAEEACRYLFVYLTFLGAIAGLKDNEHLGIDMLVKKLPYNVKKVIFVISNLAVVFCLWLVLEGSWKMTLVTQESRTPAMGLPMSFIYGIGIVTSISMALIIFYNLYRVMFKSITDEELITVKESEELMGTDH